jgi:very-short-patch-repair endonuclease
MVFPLPFISNGLCLSIGATSRRQGGVAEIMHKRTTPNTFARAKELHRNMSSAEAKLWKHLRAHQMGDVHFRNQHAIGNYIVDFCAPRKKLIIELDGSQHLEQQNNHLCH